ncbi:MAG: acyl-CoA dehydrogenase, partial [bacterium]|nr:acyl-CoA dehydrogenase [bacterium]
MDFELSKEDQLFREEVEEFCQKEMPSGWLEKCMFWPGGWGTFPAHEEGTEEYCEKFVRKLGERGWLQCLWPKEYGGMGSAVKQAILYDVLHYYRLPDGDIAAFIAGPTLLQVASEEMKKEWLPRIASGDATFWLGYSEPNAGSDLASLQMKAEDAGDHYIVNGQKTWSSGAHQTKYA